MHHKHNALRERANQWKLVVVTLCRQAAVLCKSSSLLMYLWLYIYYEYSEGTLEDLSPQWLLLAETTILVTFAKLCNIHLALLWS